MSQFTRTFLRPSGDAILLLVALAAANLLIGRSDPGWLQINPAPFLAVPVLIGARYGFLAGFGAGLATAAAILGGRFALIGEIPADTWAAYPITLAAFPALGALSGELRRLYAAKIRKLDSSNNRFRSANTHLGLEVDLLRETNRNIAQNAALHGSELAAIDVELRDILSSGDAGIFGNTFAFLRRATGVEEAALFSKRGSGWSLVASSVSAGQESDFELGEIGEAMAGHACRQNEIITWAGLWNANPTSDPIGPWLAALPWAAPGSEEPSSVLMVRTLPLRQANWDNFARIATICNWVAGLAVARLTDAGTLSSAKPLKPAQFHHLLRLATATAADHRIPSAMLVLRPNPGAGLRNPRETETEIATVLRPTDTFAPFTANGSASYAVLLPLAGLRDAETILFRFKNLSGEVLQIDGEISADELFRNLSTSGPQIDDPTRPEPDGNHPLEKADPSAEPA